MEDKFFVVKKKNSTKENKRETKWKFNLAAIEKHEQNGRANNKT